jgi:hypothetical protein
MATRHRFATLSFTVALALAGVVALLWLLGGSLVALAQAGTGVIRVATTGSDTPGCGSQATPCRTVQYAVDQAQVGEEVRVAAGDYTDIHVRDGVTQTVYISKTVTVRGGYTTTNWITPYPITQPTTLDAQKQGRVLYITGGISPTVEGLHITGGYVKASGGGIYNEYADLALINTTITNNISNGPTWGDGLGGGVYVRNGSMVLSEVQIISNSASYKGGGVLVWGGDVTLNGGQIINNTANGPTGWDGGGGMFVLGSATLSGGQIISNSAHSGGGGGLYLYLSDVTLSGGQILDNSAAGGGGVLIWGGDVTLNGGQIISNSARNGGGVFSSGTFTQTGVSTIAHNFAIGRGGGIFVNGGRATLSGGHIVSNTAGQDGGGILLWQSTANATLTNSVVADNRADGLGSGLYIGGGSSRLLHTTIARNLGGDGSGVHVEGSATVAMTNTILVSHTVGITVAAGNTATLECTLWGTGAWANDTDWGGAGTIITGTCNYWGDPAFLDPDAGDYHIGPGSAAIDMGVDAGVTTDIDGDTRDAMPDLGADERAGIGIYLPIILKDG